MITDINELEKLIRVWGVERNITQDGGCTPQDQISKLIEELAECVSTLGKIEQKKWHLYGANAYDVEQAYDEMVELEQKLCDDYGDMIVCIIQAMRLSGTDMIECLNQSWNEIKDRKGYMKNGKFIKINEEIL